jgi:uncharacterized MAPEG superfamily protein
MDDLVLMDLAARRDPRPRRDSALLALRDAYEPAVRDARLAVGHTLGGASAVARAAEARRAARHGAGGEDGPAGRAAASLAVPAAVALQAAPFAAALLALALGAAPLAAAALGAVLWIAARPVRARLDRGPLYAAGSPRLAHAGIAFLLGDLADAHAAELLERAGAPAEHVAELRRRWDRQLAAVIAWEARAADPA